MVPTQIKGNLVCLRRFHPADAAPLFEAVRESLAELSAFMTWCHQAYSLEDSRTFIIRSSSDWDKGEQYNFAIYDSKETTLMGVIGLNHINQSHRFANIGYWVRQSCTRRGTGTAATLLVAEFGLGDLGLQRLEILIPDHNIASRRVAEKTGAKFEGRLRNRLVLADEAHDALLYSLTRRELPSKVSQYAASTVYKTLPEP